MRAVRALPLMLLLPLSACQSPGSTGVRDALDHLGGIADAERVSLQIVDVAAAAEGAGFSTDSLDRPEPGDPSSAWRQVALDSVLADPLTAVPLAADLGVGWTVHGLATDTGQFRVVGGLGDGVDATRDSLVEAGYRQEGERLVAPPSTLPMEVDVVFDGDRAYQRQAGRAETLTGGDRPASKHPGIASLLDCLDGAQYIALSAMEDGRSIALGASVSDGGAESSAWACLLVPGQAAETAQSLTPNSPGVSVSGTRVDGDVVRADLAFSDQDDASLPGPLRVVLGLPEQSWPGF